MRGAAAVMANEVAAKKIAAIAATIGAARIGFPCRGSKLIISASRVAAKIARRAGEGRRAYRPYGRALRRTRRRFSLQPEMTRTFPPLAVLFVAHCHVDHVDPHA